MKITNEGRLVGILGTLIIHLIAGIIFMSFKIDIIKRNISNKFEIEFATSDVPKINETPIELPATSIEKILQGDEEMMNIARNLANKSEEKIDPADYIDKVKEELIKSGKLGPDNYIDEQKRLSEAGADEKMSFENRKEENTDASKPRKSQEMAANYKGPTRIYYDLTGRNGIDLPLPIYLCQGSGKVVLSIEVNQNGIVENARVISEESSASDKCLLETAVQTAMISRFNPDVNSPKIQTGTLTYIFVAQ